MARGSFALFLHYLHTRQRSADGDAALLARYVADRDESSFTELVRRHGPLVWHVCRQVLGHEQDAEDAFQATFLLLSRGARSVRDGAAVAGWLHRTAWRVAHKARTAAAVRRERESRALVREVADAATDVALRELQALLHEEVARLPAKYRAPFVLCVLEGRGRAEVAHSLGWNEGTLSTRLAWARQRLRVRLARRGVDVAAALCAAELARGTAPAALVKATVAAAVSGSVPAAVGILISGGIGTVFMTKVQQLTALALLGVALMAGTAGLRGVGPRIASQLPEKAATPPAAAAALPAPVQRELTCPVTVVGTATGPDGQPVNGASIVLMIENGSLSQIAAKTTTNAQGRYEFRSTPVPIGENAPIPLDPTFDKQYLPLQVHGTAPGLAFAWHPPKRIEIRRAAPTAEQPRAASFTAAPQTMNLTFARPTYFQGQIRNEFGRPVVGAEVRLSGCNSLRVPQYEGESAGFSMLSTAVPKSMTTVTTDGDGRFRLGGLPPDLIGRLWIGHPDYVCVDLYAAHAEPTANALRYFRHHPTAGPDNPVWTGDIELTFRTPRSIPVRVVSSTTGEPVPEVYVNLYNWGKVRLDSSGKTDATGRAVLRMSPGEYTLYARAPQSANYVLVYDKVTIAAEPAEQPQTARIVPGCVLKIEAVEADTGSPVASVKVTYDPPRGNYSDTGYSQSSETDAQGQVRIVVEPGKRRVMVEHPGYEAVKGPTEPVELPAGQEVKLRFELRKKGQPPAPPAAAAPPQARQPATVPVTVAGSTIGPDNEPVSGATIYLMTQNGVRVATTTTDRQGRYAFRDAPVPLRDPGDDKDHTSRILQVCGTAPGFAFAWKPRFSVELVKPPLADGRLPVFVPIKPASGEDRPPVLQKAAPRAASEPQRVDLVFGKPEAFAGRIVDEQGRPVAGVKVHVRFGDWLRQLWPSGDTSFWTLDGALPAAMTTATTGSDGRFRLGGVPHNFLARLDVTHPDYADIDVYAATTDLPVSGNLGHFMAHPDAGPQNPVWTGEISLMLVPPRATPVRVVSDKTGEPLKDVHVSLFNRGSVRVTSSGQTDDTGRASLRMPPGEYTFYVLAPHGAGFIRLTETVTVAAAPAEQPRAVRLVPACTVEIEAVDADTGFPVRKVRFEQQSATKPNVWEVVDDTATGYVNGMWGKETDKWGKVTAIVQPGKRTIRPASPFVAAGESKPVELPAGETVKLRILVREKE